jgi:hypothetical protein
MHGLFYPNLAVCQPEYSFWYYFLLGAIISLYPSNEHAMNNLFSSLFDLLSNSPGSLIYHLVLVFTIALSLQALLVNRRLTGDSAARRMVVGFLLLLVVQVILFLSTGLAWQGLANPHQFLPPGFYHFQPGVDHLAVGICPPFSAGGCAGHDCQCGNYHLFFLYPARLERPIAEYSI